MDVKKRLSVVLAASLALLFFGWTAAAGTVSLNLTATKDQPGATGTAYFEENGLSIEASGLRPDSVYTVWLVNMKPEKHAVGAGSAPYMFKTDAYGNGAYETTLPEAPFGKWAMIMIVLHPNGDPADMKHMVGALSARLPGM